MAQFVNMRKVDLLNGEPAVFSLRQLYYADQEANKIGAIVYMGGEPYALSGTCTGTAIRADGTTVPMQGHVDGNQAYITLIPDCYAIEGSIQIFVKITIGDVVATLAAAVGTVRLTETEAVIDPGEIIPSVSALITAINDAVESIPADYSGLLAAIAPNYTDLVFPVSAGTWCWHDGGLYRAAVDIPTTETWTAAHWETAPLSNSLAADIKNRVSYAAAQTLTETQQATARDNIGAAAAGDIADLKSAIDMPTNLVWAYTDNHYIATGNAVTSIDISSPYTESAIYHGKSDFRACTPGDVFVATLTGAVGYKPYVFVDSVGNVLEKSDNTIINKRFVAPANAAYVGFNSAGANDYVQIGEDRFDQLDNKYDQRCDAIEQTIDDIQDSLGSVTQLVWAYTDNHYINTKNSPKDVSSPYSTSASYHGKADFRACLPGDVFIVSLKGDTNFVPFIFCDASGNILVRADNVQYHNERVVAPPSSAYVGFNSVPADAYGTVQIGEYTVDKLQAEIDDVKDDQYSGLNGVAFGTSLTYRAQTTNGYLQYLPQLSGITFDNQGIGSATIMSGILAAIKGYDSYSGKNVCILEGFVNDWYGSNPLGSYTDTGETTVCGCVRTALNYILSQNADMTIFLVLDHYGKNASNIDCSSVAQRGGKTQFEYYEEIAKVAGSIGIPVIKLYAESQISENTPQYLSDNIHPTAIGAKQTANCIWSRMREFVPNVVT